jgi:hypothetical protein
MPKGINEISPKGHHIDTPPVFAHLAAKIAGRKARAVRQTGKHSARRLHNGKPVADSPRCAYGSGYEGFDGYEENRDDTERNQRLDHCKAGVRLSSVAVI